MSLVFKCEESCGISLGLGFDGIGPFHCYVVETCWTPYTTPSTKSKIRRDNDVEIRHIRASLEDFNALSSFSWLVDV